MIDTTAIKCPDCGSDNIEPISRTPLEWECQSCGYVFGEDDIDDETEAK